MTNANKSIGLQRALTASYSGADHDPSGSVNCHREGFSLLQLPAVIKDYFITVTIVTGYTLLQLKIVQFTDSVACHEMAGLHFFQLWELVVTSLGRILAARCETARVRRLDRARDLALDQDTVALVIDVDTRDRRDHVHDDSM